LWGLIHHFGEFDARVMPVISGRFGNLGKHSARWNVSRAANHSIEFFINKRLNRPQLFLDLPPLIDEGGKLLVDALKGGHSPVCLLEQGDGG
jgi:hypothetical protein